jgi:4-diphosphocytidyl-2-C-methyl-D-erythritol kinase
VTRLRANAKINLWLRVVGQREDGFHDIETVFQNVDLADELSFALMAREGVEVSMAYEDVPAVAVPKPEDNLVWRAATEMLSRSSGARGARIDVRKRIPTGAGLGGGSADAAATLVATNELLELGLSKERLIEVAAGFGSDTSFSVLGGTALGTGRGELLTPVNSPSLALVLGLSFEPLLTGEVYARCSPGGDGGSEALVAALGAGAEAIAPLLRNDLEQAAFSLRPELREKKKRLLRAGALGALVSGSGPTLFGLCRDDAHAAEVAATCEDIALFDRVVVTRTKSPCVEPA